MEIYSLRNNFSIYFLSVEGKQTTLLKNATNNTGFNIQHFIDEDMFFKNFNDNPCHIVLFNASSLKITFKEFLEKIKNICNETLIIGFGSDESYLQIKKYFIFGLYDYIIDFSELNDLIIWRLDKACEILYHQYKSEQLLDKLTHLEKKLDNYNKNNNHSTTSNNSNKENNSSAVFSNDEESFSKNNKKLYKLLQKLIYEFEDKENFSQLINSFFHFFPNDLKINIKGVFLKYDPQNHVLFFEKALGISEKSLDGVGIKFSQEDQKKISIITKNIEKYNPLIRLIREGLKAVDYILIPLNFGWHNEGLIILFSQQNEIKISMLNLDVYISIFKIFCEKVFIKNKAEKLEYIDPPTELYNVIAFRRFLEEEIARAARLELPVSLIYLVVDDLKAPYHKLLIEEKKIILKTIGRILKKDSRANDITARIKDNNFAFILPHTDNQQASIKAERIKKFIEGISFKLSEDKIKNFNTFIGISEYPSLAIDATNLLESAQKAIINANKTKNNICFAQITKGFKPDFKVK